MIFIFSQATDQQLSHIRQKLESFPNSTNSGKVYGNVALGHPRRAPVTMATVNPIVADNSCHGNTESGCDSLMTFDNDVDCESYYVIDVSAEATPCDEQISVSDHASLRDELRDVEDDVSHQLLRRQAGPGVISQRDSGYKEGEELFV